MRYLSVLFFIFSSLIVKAQLHSGPMLGYVEHREALVWIAADTSASVAEIVYYNDPGNKRSVKFNLQKPHNITPLSFVLKDLEMNTNYTYEILINGKHLKDRPVYNFKTKMLWEWRMPAPDFSFLIGSCAFRNDSLHDRPGKPYGQGMKIYESMGSTTADFNIWGGDNLYFRESDLTSESGLRYRYAYDRRFDEQKKLLSSRPNFAIWDDHDYGANDANSSYELKNESRKLFTEWWGNKKYGEDGQGIYSTFSWSDCDFFLLDDRYFRSANAIADSIDGKANPEKRMFGERQMSWLKNALLSSRASFRFIVCGGQILNTSSRYECLSGFPAEYKELLDFLEENKVEGVVFLSGDRHMSELIKKERSNAYPLYDFTCSPLSSGVFRLTEKEREFNNPDRVKGSLISENNFARLSVKGARGERNLYLEVFDTNGKVIWNFTIPANELKYKKK